MEKSYVTGKNLLKFLLGSAFGILMFLVPIPQGDSFTTLLDFLKSWIKGLFGASLPYIIVVILIVSAVLSVYDYLAKPDWIRKNHYLTRAFSTTTRQTLRFRATILAELPAGRSEEACG